MCAPGFHVGSSGTRATPADHTDTLHPSGVHIALLTGPLGVVGPAPAHREGQAGDAGLTRATPLPGAGSSWARVAASGRAAAPRPPGVHVALARRGIDGWVGLRRGPMPGPVQEFRILQAVQKSSLCKNILIERERPKSPVKI